MHRLQDLAPELALSHPFAEAAGPGERFDRSRRMRRDLEHGFVPHDPPARQIALSGRRLAPRRQLAQHAEEPPVDPAAQSKPVPRLARIAAVGFAAGQLGHFLGKPARPAVRRELLLQLLVDGAQVDDVGEGIADLPLGERPMRPVGKSRGFVERGAGELGDQGLIARRIAEAADHAGNLGIEERYRHRAGQVEKYLDILARRVEYLERSRIRHQGEKRREVDSRRERIDCRRFLGTRHLHEAEDRPIRPLAHELGVDRNKARALLPFAKVLQRIRVSDYRHDRRYIAQTTERKAVDLFGCG